ncbi:MAG TPA: hypothetical protein VMT51_08885 [Dongiaceae bacterium]|nr:hypothetical protein [Dongiaceae bacterium]
MSRVRACCIFLLAIVFVRASQFAAAQTPPVGAFESHGDVGTVLHPGSAEYDAAKDAYTVSASGENVWFAKDAYQFVWKKVSGDVSLAADISFLGAGTNPHRKALLMIRQSLDPDSVYADIARHGNGMTAIQFRLQQGGLTREVQAATWSPTRLRIEKHGAYFSMWLAGSDGQMRIAGASPRIELKEPFYVGIGLSSHEPDIVEKAVFSKVEMKALPPASGSEKPTLYSFLEWAPVDSGDRTAIYVSQGRFEAPNWSPDGKFLLFNRDGRLLRLPIVADASAPPPQNQAETIDTGFANRLNNDHGLSREGTLVAFSDQSQEDHRSLVYIMPLAGGEPRRVTKNSPSYWHGWSPDGKTLAFVGQRNGDFDIYTISIEGGAETRLTTAQGLDDGPEYSPDGQYIYFNSERTGHMQIWRMKTDGSEQEQVFSDELNNWFPHISPDGKYMAFLTFDRGVSGHPENKDVQLRLMTLADKKITVIANLFGGQGTINVPSWSPDSKKIAFVSYALIPGQAK